MYIHCKLLSMVYHPKLSHLIGICAVLMVGVLFLSGYIDLKLGTEFSHSPILWSMYNYAPFVAIFAGIVFLLEFRHKNKQKI